MIMMMMMMMVLLLLLLHSEGSTRFYERRVNNGRGDIGEAEVSPAFTLAYTPWSFDMPMPTPTPDAHAAR